MRCNTFIEHKFFSDRKLSGEIYFFRPQGAET